MMFIRPVQPKDLDDLLTLAESSAGGITSLPPNRRLLHEKIERSQFAFSRDVMRPKGEAYLLVLEDPEQKRVVGCSGILSKTGGYEPLWSYHVSTQKKHSHYLDVEQKIQLLELQRIHDGPTEVCTLFLDQDHRHGGLGRLLSLCRFLFIALHRPRFETRVDALLRGALDKDDVPLFWKAVCAPFFNISFAKADALRYSDPRFVEELVPKHPLYAPLLPEEVQKTIGKTHERTRPAHKMLSGEGFHYSRNVDIFDAGPSLSCPTDHLWTVRNRREAAIGTIAPAEGYPQILCNHRLGFRAVLAPLVVEGGQATIDQETANALQVEVGDPISYRPIHGGN